VRGRPDRTGTRDRSAVVVDVDPPSPLPHAHHDRLAVGVHHPVRTHVLSVTHEPGTLLRITTAALDNNRCQTPPTGFPPSSYVTWRCLTPFRPRVPDRTAAF